MNQFKVSTLIALYVIGMIGQGVMFYRADTLTCRNENVPPGVYVVQAVAWPIISSLVALALFIGIEDRWYTTRCTVIENDKASRK